MFLKKSRGLEISKEAIKLIVMLPSVKESYRIIFGDNTKNHTTLILETIQKRTPKA